MDSKNRKLLIENFIRCGIAGWCLEILFTAAESLMRGDLRMMGQTSLIMFPIYGLGALLLPIWEALEGRGKTGGNFKGICGRYPSPELRLIFHGIVDMVLIFSVEYLTGTGLKQLGICPWDYSLWPDQIDGVIRLGFAPLWFGTGLLFGQLSKRPV